MMSGLPVFYAGLLSSSLFAFIIFKLRSNSGNSAAIGLTTSIMISLSLVLAYSYPGQINVTKYLVGDIISASSQDIKLLFFILLVVLIFFLSALVVSYQLPQRHIFQPNYYKHFYRTSDYSHQC